MKHLKLFLCALVLFTGAFFMPQNVQAQTYKGIDVYEYDNISDWNTVKNNGISVVIQKASEGLHHNDSLLQYRYPRILQAGLKIGYYHFADNTGQPVAEAQHFLSRINGLHSDTVLWLDIENQPNWTKWQAINYTNSFINYVQSQGYKIGIYTGLSFYYEYLNGSIPSNIPVWLASYGKQPVQYPSVVSWQYSESGRMSGVIGAVDTDYFNDSIFTGVKPVVSQNSTSNINTKSTTNSSIMSLQEQLNSLINANLVADGQDGPRTQAAVEKFQSIMGLAVDGIAGTNTWNAINQIRSYPVDGIMYKHYEYATRWIQWRVGSGIDGKYGYGTASKVQAFQREYNLYSDGITGPMTWNAMFKY